MGDLLQVDFPEMPYMAPDKLEFLGTTWHAVPLTVTLSIEPFRDIRWEAEVEFIVEEGLPFAILGYEGFLNRWAVSFNGGLGYFSIEPTDEFHSRFDESAMADLRRRFPDLFPREWT